MVEIIFSTLYLQTNGGLGGAFFVFDFLNDRKILQIYVRI